MESREHQEALQRMQNYIHENIMNPITLSNLANVAGYSPWYSAKIFKEIIGKTPFDYIRSLRLANAAMRFQNSKCKVIDVAFDFVFDSHEGFTRAFSKEFGVSPKDFKKKPFPIRVFIPGNFRVTYLTLKKGEITMPEKIPLATVFVQVVDRGARKLILKRGIKATHYFEYCDEVGCEIWEILSNIKEALYEPIGMWMPPSLIEPNTSLYTQGVEVPIDYCGEIPEGFDIINLKPCKMMVFQGPPFEEEKFGEAIDELWKAIENFNPELYGFEWADEDAPKFQLIPIGYRGYIEAKPVRQIGHF